MKKSDISDEFSRNQSEIEKFSKKLSIFQLDGTNFKPDKQSVKLIVKSPQINEFIMTNKHNPNSVLIGPKGSGKSLLLRLRSWKNYNESDSYNLEDQEETINLKEGDELTIKFLLTGSLSTDDLISIVKKNDFRIVWDFCIKHFILKQLMIKYKIEIPLVGNNIEDLPGSSLLGKVAGKYGVRMSNLGGLVSTVLRNRTSISEFEEEIIGLNDILYLLMDSEVLKRRITLYIDNVDQAFLSQLNNVLQGYPMAHWVYNRDKIPVVKIWLHANMAFLDTVLDINKTMSKISLFASMRYEAWNYYLHSGRMNNIPQNRSNVIVLEYQEDELKELIGNFISVVHPDKIQSIMNRIVREDRIHPKARDSRANKEKLSDLMIRHTFGNPRDLIVLLKGLAGQIIRNEKAKRKHTVEKYALYINEHAHKVILEDFMNECLPVFPKDEMNRFLKKNPYNYFEKSILSDEDFVLIQELYRFGLVGKIDENGKQQFVRGSMYPEESIKLGEKDELLLLHPCLDFELESINPKDFYYPFCIIGNGLDFKTKHREDYYIPNENYLPKHKEQIIKKIKEFYDTEESAEILEKLPLKTVSQFSTLIMRASSERRGKSQLINELEKSIFDKGLISCSSNKMKIELMENNYQLRIIITICYLFEIFETGEEVMNLFDNENYSEPMHTVLFTKHLFTRSPKKFIDDGKVNKLLNSMSKFEIEGIHYILWSSNFKEYIATVHSSLRKIIKDKLERAKEIFLHNFPRFDAK